MSTSYMQKSSVIRQKGQSQNGCFRKTKHVEFSEKRTFFYPLIRTGTCAYQGVKPVRFSENLACFVFLKTHFEVRPFALLPSKCWWCRWLKRMQEIHENADNNIVIFLASDLLLLLRIKRFGDLVWLTENKCICSSEEPD